MTTEKTWWERNKKHAGVLVLGGIGGFIVGGPVGMWVGGCMAMGASILHEASKEAGDTGMTLALKTGFGAVAGGLSSIAGPVGVAITYGITKNTNRITNTAKKAFNFLREKFQATKTTSKASETTRDIPLKQQTVLRVPDKSLTRSASIKVAAASRDTRLQKTREKLSRAHKSASEKFSKLRKFVEAKVERKMSSRKAPTATPKSIEMSSRSSSKKTR